MNSNREEIDYSAFVETAQKAARAAGDVLIQWLGRASATEKGPGDYVTQADLDSQRVIYSIIHAIHPSHGFLGEEDAPKDLKLAMNEMEYCWIVDPLDGTTNYIHQLNSFSVSIALLHRGRIVMGTVFDPILNEMYSASLGTGATLNNQPIHVSPCTNLDHSLLVCSFSRQVERNSLELKRFLNVLCHTQSSLRRLGSAALNLAYVAAGRLDGYWATSLKVWDMAAGAIILTEAGGVIQHIDLKPLDLCDPQFLATNNQRMQEQIGSWLQV